MAGEFLSTILDCSCTLYFSAWLRIGLPVLFFNLLPLKTKTIIEQERRRQRDVMADILGSVPSTLDVLVGGATSDWMTAATNESAIARNSNWTKAASDNNNAEVSQYRKEMETAASRKKEGVSKKPIEYFTKVGARILSGSSSHARKAIEMISGSSHH